MTSNLVMSAKSGATVEGASTPYLGIFARAGDDHVVRVWLPVEDATDPRKCVPELLKAGLRSYNQTKIKQALSVALEDVQPISTKVVVQSGWQGRSFVFNGCVCTGKGKRDFFLHQELRQAYTSYPCEKNDELIDFIDEFAEKSDFLAVATMIAFAQPLLGLLPSPERPIIYFWGKSRTGKTTLGSLINAIARPPSDRSLVSFDSTPRAFEETLQYYSDSVAVFDELNTLDDAAIERILSPFIYTASNGRGRSRSKGSNFPDLRWRTTSVITGEKDLSGLKARRQGSGQDARLITLPLPDRKSGGMWTGSMTKKERKQATKKLSRVTEAYSGHSFLQWIKYIVTHQDKLRPRLDETVSAYAGQLVGENDDSLFLSTAEKFAQLAATGDELIRAGIVDWDRKLPFQVIQRLFEASTTPEKATKSLDKDARQYALTILANVGVKNVVKRDEDDANSKAFLKEWDGVEFVMIEKGAVPDFTGAPEENVMSAFRSRNLTVASGSTPYFQDRKANKRYLRVSVEELKSVALVSPIL